MDAEWTKLLTAEFSKPYYKNLFDTVEKEYKEHTVYPPKSEMFAALDCVRPSDIKVVIIGQDPYHGAGQANGLCFSVAKGVTIPPSLKNIYKEIKNEYPDKEIPSDGDLTRWAKQGVLLLNSILTVRAGEAASHAGIGWEQFTEAIVKATDTIDKPIVYLLWGKNAGEKASLLHNPKHLVLTTSHPSPYSANRGFLGCNHFKKANDFLVEYNETTIEW